jgi:hypothetical protein
MQPPCSARRRFSSGEIFAIWSSFSHPVALTPKQPLSSAWWRIRHLDLIGEYLSRYAAWKVGDMDLLVLRHQREREGCNSPSR